MQTQILFSIQVKSIWEICYRTCTYQTVSNPERKIWIIIIFLILFGSFFSVITSRFQFENLDTIRTVCNYTPRTSVTVSDHHLAVKVFRSVQPA